MSYAFLYRPRAVTFCCRNFPIKKRHFILSPQITWLFLAKGGSLNEMISEFHGKSSGTNGGLAGSQELSCHKTNFYSGTILSGALAMSVGDAFEKKYNKKNNITVAVIGDRWNGRGYSL